VLFMETVHIDDQVLVPKYSPDGKLRSVPSILV